MTGDRDIAVLGVGHAPVGQVGPQLRRVRRRGRARRARRRRRSAGATCSSSPAPTRAQRLPRLRRRRDVRPGARLDGRSRSRRATRPARRARPRSRAARAQILAGLCDVALVVGADTTPKGFLAPNAGDRPDDPDWLRFRLLGATNPTYFALYARRRMDLYGATERDFAKVKVKNARHGLRNPNARATARRSPRTRCSRRPIVADRRCTCSTSARRPTAAPRSSCRRWSSPAVTARANPVRVRGISTVTPTFPNTVIEMPNFATDSSAALAPPTLTFRDSIAAAAYEEAGIGPDDLSLAEVYDLSSALELDWYENIGLCKAGEAERLINDGDTALGGKGVTVNPSGGLACFGEAVPAQAHRPGVRDRVAAARPGRRPPGRRRHRRRHRQPGPLRPRLLVSLTLLDSGTVRWPATDIHAVRVLAGDAHDLAGHVPRVVAGEEHDHVRDLPRLGGTAERLARRQLLEHLVGRHLRQERVHGEARRDRVDPHAELGAPRSPRTA